MRPFPAALAVPVQSALGTQPNPRLGILVGQAAEPAARPEAAVRPETAMRPEVAIRPEPLLKPQPRSLTTLVTDIVGKVVGSTPAAPTKTPGTELTVIALTLGLIALAIAWPLHQAWLAVSLSGLGLLLAGAIVVPLAWRRASGVGLPVTAALVNLQGLVLAIVAVAAGEPASVNTTEPRFPAIANLAEALASPDTATRIQAVAEVGALARNMEEALGELLRALDDPDAEVRGAAVDALTQIGPRARVAFPALEHAARSDDNDSVRQACRAAMKKIGPPTYADRFALIEFLKDARPALKAAAARALGSIGPEAVEVAPKLEEALLDADAEVQVSAAQALWLIQQKQSREMMGVLVKGLQARQPAVRVQAAETLGNMRVLPAEAIDALALALRDRDSVRVRVQAAFALGSLKKDESVKRVLPRLSAALEDSDPKVQLVAAQALWALDRQTQGVPVLIKALQNVDSEIRISAAVALKHMDKDAKPAVMALSQCLRDGDAEVRLRAAEALYHIGPSAWEAVPALILALQHEDPDFKAKAAIALSGIGRQARSAAPQLDRLLEDKNPGPRLFAARALWVIEGKEKDLLPVCRAILADPKMTSYLRTHAAITLGMMGAKAAPAVPDLHETFKENDATLRAAAAKAIGDIGGPFARVAFPTLLELGRDEQPDETVRLAATRAAKALGVPRKADVETFAKALDPAYPPSFRASAAVCLMLLQKQAKPAVTALAGCLKDQDRSVRAMAAYALSAIGPDAAEAVPALRKALSHEDKLLCAQAAHALGKIGPDAQEAVPELKAILNNDKEEPGLRLSAAQALWSLQANAADLIPVLSKGLADKDTDVAVKAATTLARIGASSQAQKGQVKQALTGKAVPALRLVLRGKTEEEEPEEADDAAAANEAQRRREAAAALGELGFLARAALPELTSALEEIDSDPAFLAVVVEAVGKIGAAELKNKSAVWAKAAYSSLFMHSKFASSEQVQKAANTALVRIGAVEPKDADALVDIMEDKKQPAPFRTHAAQVLGAMIGRDAAPVAARLSKLLRATDDAEVRGLAAYCLGDIGPAAKKEWRALATALKEGDAALQSAAAYALGEIFQGDPRTAQEVTEQLEITARSSDVNVAAAAAAALKKIPRK